MSATKQPTSYVCSVCSQYNVISAETENKWFPYQPRPEDHISIFTEKGHLTETWA